MDTVGTAAQFIKMLSKASPSGVWKLVNNQVWKTIAKRLEQMEESLDFTQALLNLVGEKSAVNPVMNAVVDAFIRRRFTGRFRSGNQSIELDTLLNASTKGSLDDDENTKNVRVTNSQSKIGGRICYLFQSDSCT